MARDFKKILLGLGLMIFYVRLTAQPIIDQVVQIGHAKSIKGIQVMPEYNLILSYDDQRSILWEFNSGRRINEFNLNNDKVLELFNVLAIPEKNLCISNVYHLVNGISYSTLDWLTLDYHSFLFSTEVKPPKSSENNPMFITDIKLSTDHKIIYAASGYHLTLINALTGALINTMKTPVGGLPEIKLSEDGFMLIYGTDNDNNFNAFWYNTVGKLKFGQIEFHGISSASAALSRDHKYLAIGTDSGEVWLIRTKDQKLIRKYKVIEKGPVTDVYFPANNGLLFINCQHDDHPKQVQLNSGVISDLKIQSEAYNKINFTQVPGKNQLISCNNQFFNLYDESTSLLLKSYETFVDESFYLKLNRRCNKLFLDNNIIDLNTFRSVPTNANGSNFCFQFSDTSLLTSENHHIIRSSINGVRSEAVFAATPGKTLDLIAESDDGKYVVATSSPYNEASLLYVFRQPDSSFIKKFQFDSGDVVKLEFIAGTHNLLILQEKILYLFNLDSNTLLRSFTPGKVKHFLQYVAYDSLHKIIAYTEGFDKISFYSLAENKYVFTFKNTTKNSSMFEGIEFNPLTRHWVVLRSDASLQVLNDSFLSVGRKVYGNGANVFSIDPFSRKLYLSSDQGFTNCWKFDSVESDLTFQFQIISVYRKDKAHDFIYRTLAPDWYYFAPKTSIAAFHYVQGLKTFPYDQFDFFLNHPAEVLKKAGSNDTTLMKLYQKAFDKSHQENPLWLEKFTKFYTPDLIPSVRILNKNKLQPVNFTGKVTLDLGVWFPHGSKLKGVYFTDNRVPVKWTHGKDLNHYKDSLLDNESAIRMQFQLQEGRNNFRFKIGDQNGLESFTESLEIIYVPKKPVKRKIYFVGIAVSDYEDKNMKLKYAAKDIRDLVSMYKKYADSSGVSIEIDTFINQSATRSNIYGVQNKLMKSDVEDIIIWVMSGHGLLDDSLNFYYATYDCNFLKPSEKGLRYESVEKLLRLVPSRHRLMLIDACHSGEIDKEKLYVKKETSANDTIPSYVSKGNELLIDSSVTFDNSFDLMRLMFDDFIKDNGIEVISAAAGSEFALESDRWHNGAFTYSILEAMRNLNADENKDGRISVNELKSYVSKRVFELTNGSQNPTSRKENPESEWFVY